MINKTNYKRLLKHNNTNSRQLAIMLNITRPTLYNYINNKRDIPTQTALNICYLLHCELTEIYKDNSKEIFKGGR